MGVGDGGSVEDPLGVGLGTTQPLGAGDGEGTPVGNPLGLGLGEGLVVEVGVEVGVAVALEVGVVVGVTKVPVADGLGEGVSEGVVQPEPRKPWLKCEMGDCTPPETRLPPRLSKPPEGFDQ